MLVRVLQIVPSLFEGGGAERVAVDLAVGLSGRGHESLLCSLYDPPGGSRLLEQLERAGVSFNSLGKRPGPSPAVMVQLRSHVRSVRPQVLNTHLSGCRYALGVSRADFGVAFHTIHNLPSREAPGLLRLPVRIALSRGFRPVILSSRFEEDLFRTYGRVRYDVIPNGVIRSAPGPAATRDREVLQVVAVARLARQKRIDLLLEAFSQVTRVVRRPVRLVIAGDGPERESLTNRAAVLGLASQVEFRGIVKDVSALLAASDVFVLTSDYEGMPLAIAEAMAAGLPIVATRVGALEDMVSDGQSGFLTPAGDPGATALCLQELIADARLRSDFGRAGAAASMRFLVSNMVEEYEAMYLRYLGSS